MKSPLRYPGGKSRAVKRILPFIEGKTTELLSPFVGGASIEIAAAQKGIKVYAYDIFTPLVHFWQQLLLDANKVADKVNEYFPLKKEDFYVLQKKLKLSEDPIEIASLFFVINRCSFSGTTQSGGMSPNHPRFNQASIQRLRDFLCENMEVSLGSFEQSLKKYPSMFAYLDPPYALGMSSNLYGNKGDTHLDFNHINLSHSLKNRGMWVLSYNDCEIVRDLYQGHIFKPIEWTYGMNKSKKSNEVLIFSKDLKY